MNLQSIQGVGVKEVTCVQRHELYSYNKIKVDTQKSDPADTVQYSTHRELPHRSQEEPRETVLKETLETPLLKQPESGK